MNVGTAPERFVQPFPFCPLDNFLNREIWRFGMLAMQQGSCYPNLVGYLQYDLGR
jgi:hypothetical protein